MPSMVRRKMQGIDSSGISTSLSIQYGEFALKVTGLGSTIGEKELEAAKKAATKIVKLNGGVVISRLNHKMSVTSKGIGARLGGGKGGVDRHVFNAKSGMVILECLGVSEEIARKAFSAACSKLSVAASFVKKKFVY